MIRKTLRKFMSLTMALVMIFSSSLLYAPTLAHGWNYDSVVERGPTYTIVDGQNILPVIMEDILADYRHEGLDISILLKDQNTLLEGFQVRFFELCYGSLWMEFTGEPRVGDIRTIEINSTNGLSPRTEPYELVAVLKCSDHEPRAGCINVELTWHPLETIYLQVLANNAPEIKRDKDFSLDEDSGLTNITLGGAILEDVDGDEITLTAARIREATTGGEDVGSISFLGKNIAYTPAPDYNGTFEIVYSVEDEHGLAPEDGSGYINVTVNPIDDPPTANDDYARTGEDVPVQINSLENDEDIDGDLLSVISFNQPPNGSVVETTTGSGIFIYTPDEFYTGDDTFVYALEPGINAQVTIYVGENHELNDIEDKGFGTLEDTPITFRAYGNNEINYGVTEFMVSHPTHGEAVAYLGGGVTYTPDKGFSGTETFDISVTDLGGDVQEATMTVVVDEVYDPPVAKDDYARTSENGFVNIDVLANDIANDVAVFEVISIIDPPNGSVFEETNGTLTYTPDLGYSGDDTFVYALEPGVTAKVTVYVAEDHELNDIADKSFETLEDTPITFRAYTNTEINNGVIEFMVYHPMHGEAVAYYGGGVTYTPDPGFSGTETFDISVIDSDGNEQFATMTVEVEAVYDPPVANDDYARTAEDVSVIIDVLANDIANDAVLGVLSFNQPPNGTVGRGINGTLVYTPNPTYSGDDTFVYAIEEGINAKVTVYVGEDHEQNSIRDKGFRTPEDTPITFRGYVDLEIHNGVTVFAVAHPTNGEAVAYVGGGVTYTPDPGFSGLDSFKIFVTDLDGDVQEATMTIGVGEVYDPPVANDDYARTPENVPVNIDVLANDIANDASLDVISFNQPPNGTVAKNRDGTLTYTPDPGYSGDDTFVYAIEESINAKVTVYVGEDHEPNDILDKEFHTAENTPITFRGYVDLEIHNGVTVFTASHPPHGEVVVYEGGGVTYTPDSGYIGTDTFTIYVTDLDGAVVEALMTIRVREFDIRPVATDDMLIIEKNDVGLIDVVLNDMIPEGLDFISITTPATFGNAVVEVGTSYVRYTPNNLFIGIDTFEYTITDNEGKTDVGMVTIEVREPDDMIELILQNDDRPTQEDTFVIIDVLENDFVSNEIVNMDHFPWLDSGPYNGTVEFLEDSMTFKYTPDKNFNGEDQFKYFVTDNDRNFDMATVEILVLPVDDPIIILSEHNFDMNRGETLEFNILEGFVVPAESNIDSFFDVFVEVASVEVTTPDFGVALAQTDGTVSYVPGDDHQGSIVFEVTFTNIYGDQATGLVFVDVDLAIDEIAVYVFPNYEGYNEEHDAFFIQQGDDEVVELIIDIEYGLVGTNLVTKEWVSVQVVEGYLDPADDFTDGTAVNVGSYGTFLVSYYAGDDFNHTGRGGPRRLLVNQQPIVSFEPVEPPIPPELVVILTEDPEFDVEADYREEGFNLLDYLYVYDYEDYDLYPDTPVGSVPEGLTIMVDDGTGLFEVDDVFMLFADLPADELFVIYDLTFIVSDTMGGETEFDMLFKVNNNFPVIEAIEDFVVLELNEDYDVWDMVTYSDIENEKDEIDLIKTLVPSDFDTSEVGMYDLEFTVEDAAGQTASAMVDVWVVSLPEVSVEPMEITMDYGGHFPTFTGVNPTFMQFPDVSETGQSSRYFNFNLRAYIIVDEEEVELSSVFTPEETGIYTIYYEATKEVWQEVWVDELTDDILIYSNTVTEMRTLIVTEEDLEDYFYMSDYFNMSPNQFDFVEPREVEEDFLFRSMYSNLIKYDPYTDTLRYVTLIDLEGELGTDPTPINMNDLDDLALTYDNELYGVKNNTFYLYDGLGSFDDVYQLVTVTNGFEGQMVYSLTAGLEDELVFILNGTELHMLHLDELLPSEEPFETFMLDLGDRYDKVTDITFNDDFTEIYGIGVNYTTEGAITIGNLRVDERPFTSELFKLLRVEVEQLIAPAHILSEFEYDEEYGVELDDNYAYRGIVNVGSDLFLTKYQFDTEEVEPTLFNAEKLFDGNKTFIEIRSYDGVLYNTEEMPVYPFNAATGAAATYVKNVDATPEFTTLNGGLGYDEFETVDLEAVLFPELTFSEEVSWTVLTEGEYVDVDADGVVTVNEENVPSGTTDVTIRAMADGLYDDVTVRIENTTFVKSLDATPESSTIHGGYGYSGFGTVDLEVVLFPEEEFVEDVSWTVLTNISYVNVDSDGVVTVNDANVPNGTSSVTIKAMADGLFDEVSVTLNKHVKTSTSTSSSSGSSGPPRPKPKAVVLDTDAITLDYGEDADPAFTSYDFKETVTGTADKRVTWSLDDDTFVTVDRNGVVTAIDDIPVGQGDITVVVTVTMVDGGRTDTATILFLENNPLGAIEFYQPYIVGYPDGSFRPLNSITRAEAATMFVNMLNLNMEYPGTRAFNDVAPEHWAYKHIQAIIRTGIFVGYEDGSFKPEDPITRAEMAQLFSNYWKFADINVNGVQPAEIPDVPVTHWASDAINKMYNTGLFTGYDDGSYKPELPTLRKDVVVMINKLLGRPANPAAASKFTDILTTHPNFGDIEAASQVYVKPQLQE